MDKEQLKMIVEGALLASGEPMTVNKLSSLFEDDDEQPASEDIRAVLKELQQDCKNRGYELMKVASGYRFQVRQQLAPWVNRLWEEKPAKYTRATLETLALIAYRQPITRGDIENVRGVAVSSGIIKSLMERDWIRIVGHRDVPGRPSLYATTKKFLDYFNLKSLEQLPALSEIKDIESLNQELPLQENTTAMTEEEKLAAEELGVQVDAGQADTAADASAEDDGNDSADASMVTLILPGG